jgi:hypothetical protein
MLRRLITATALTAVSLLGLTVPATAATTASGARMQVHTPPPPCPAGYAEWYITNGSFKYYLDAEGQGAAVEVTNTPSCWHAPGSFGVYGTFTDNSHNCLNWDQGLGEVVMALCDGAESENWKPEPGFSGVAFYNEYAINHDQANNLLAAEMFAYGSIVSLSARATDLARWFR